MANNDVRESFPSLEDASGVGVPLTKSLELDAASGKVGSTTFVFKDYLGRLVLPQLDPQGRMPTSSEPQGTRLRAPGTTVVGVLLGNPYVFTPVVTLPLIAASGYVDIRGTVNARRGALFQLLYKDNGNSVVLDESIVDSGSYKAEIGFSDDQFNVPASGVNPHFLIQAGNYDKVSDLHAALTAVLLA